MKKWILWSLVFLFSYITFLSAAEDTIKAEFSIAGEAAPSSCVNNSVNAITGSFFNSTKDLAVPGPIPMDLLRYTNSEIFSFHFMGRGMSTNFPNWIKGRAGEKRKNDFVQVQEDGGSVLEYIAKYDDRYLEFYLHPDVIHAGLTNCGSHEISARTNLKNSYYTSDISKNGKVEWRGFLADGTIRKYYKTYDFDDEMSLKEELKPSGLKLEYDYHHDGVLKKIELKDVHGEVLNWLKFDQSHKGEIVTITSSNGKQVEYKLKQRFYEDEKHLYVEKVSSSDRPTVHYDYDYIDDKPHFGRISWPDGRFLENDYDHKGRVTAQKAPVGEKGEKRTIWEFDYNSHDRYTKVKDGLGRKSIYHYSKHNRLESLEKYLAGTVFCSDHFFWGQKEKIESAKRDYNEEGHLLAKARCNGDGKAKYLKHFTYDKFGNITEEVAFGNFTGKGPDSFWLTSDGWPKEDGVDWYKKTYSYSNDRFHLKLTEVEEDGLTNEYQYKPGTDLVIAKFTCDGSDIKIREFFEYDEAACLTKKIIDDGSSHDPVNLKHVTERKITTIIPVKQRGSHGVGQPEAIIESYLNLKNNKIVQVKRTNFTYDYAGHIKTEEVLDGNDKHLFTLKYSHNSMGKLVHFFDAECNEFTYDYDANFNKIREEQIGSGFYTTYDYDKANRLIREIEHHADIGDFETSYAYDLMGNKILQIDHFGNETRYEYDDLNRLVKIILPQVSDDNDALTHPTITKECDIFDNVIAETDANGNTTRYKYNSRNQPLKITFADGSKEEFEYNRNGTLARKWDKNGTKTTYGYDFLKRVTKIHVYDQDDNQLYSTTNSYNAFHFLSSTDPMGRPTKYSYDGFGRQIEVIKKHGSKIVSRKATQYDALSRVIQTKEWFEDGEQDYLTAQIRYDKLDNIILELKTDAAGKPLEKVRYEYDVLGNKTKVITFKDEKTSFVHETIFNTLSEPIKVIDELGNTTKISYNFRHKNKHNQRVLKKTITDPLGNVAIEGFDVLGRLKYVLRQNSQDTLLAESKFIYDKAGNKVCDIEKAIINGQVDHEYIVKRNYDELNRVIELIEQPGTPDEKKTGYNYFKAGFLKKIIKPDGVTLNHTYDALGRLSTLKSSDNTISYSYSYDKNNNPLEVVDHIHNISHKRSYDALNRVTSDSFAEGVNVQLNYDMLSRVTKFAYPDNSFVEYSYQSGNLTNIVRKSENSDELYRHSYKQFDLRQNVTESELIGSCGTAQFETDAKGRTIKITTPYFQEEIPSDGFDKAGNLLKLKAKDFVGQVDSAFTYDDLYQLTSESGVSKQNYRNDSLCNRIEHNGNKCEVDTLNKLINTTNEHFEYDKNGNLIEKKEAGKTTKYRYDGLNRLTGVEKNDLTAHYIYDSLNRRIAKRISKRDGESLKEVSYSAFFYLGQRELGSVNSQGSLTECRVLGLGKKAEIGATVAVELNGRTYCPINDHRGNICSYIDIKAHEVVDARRYSAFGEAQYFNAEGAQEAKSAISSPWGFVSKRLDDETGFIYFGRRYYNPKTGRFITTDPLDFADGPNLYAYVHNSPLVLLDPYGLSVADHEDDKTIKNDAPDQKGDSINSKVGGICHGTIDFTINIFRDLHVPEFLFSMQWGGLGEQGFDLAGKMEVSEAVENVLDKQMANMENKIMDIFSVDENDATYQAYRSQTTTALEITALATTTFGVVKGISSASKLTKISSQASKFFKWEGAASSSVNAYRLKNHLIAKEIAGGHAFEKHILKQRNFPGIRTRNQFSQHIEHILNNPSAIKELQNSRVAYWDTKTKTVVIRNPSASDGGTAFQPHNGISYFEGLK